MGVFDRCEYIAFVWIGTPCARLWMSIPSGGTLSIECCNRFIILKLMIVCQSIEQRREREEGLSGSSQHS
jgi:hypothetical protein